MRLTRSRLLQVAIAVAAAGGLLFASGVAANASGGGDDDHGRVINIDVTTDGGFTMPSHVNAGFVTFKINSSEVAYHGIQGFRPQNGKTVQDVMHDLELGVLSDSAADNAAGALALQTDAVLIGGAVLNGSGPISVTVPLRRGTYTFFDLNDFFAGFTPRLHTLHVVGEFHWSGMPRFSAVIDAAMVNNQPTFVAPTSLRLDRAFLVVVTGDEIHEAVFRPTRAGITDTYLNQFYDAVVNGTPRPQSPWTGSQTGLQAMSPGRYAVVRMGIPAGDYALICYVPSDETGLPHGYTGMHQMEQLH